MLLLLTYRPGTDHVARFHVWFAGRQRGGGVRRSSNTTAGDVQHRRRNSETADDRATATTLPATSVTSDLRRHLRSSPPGRDRVPTDHCSGWKSWKNNQEITHRSGKSVVFRFKNLGEVSKTLLPYRRADRCAV